MRDEAFEALCQVCDLDWEAGITADQRGRVNAALKQLRDVYQNEDAVLPMLIHERAAAWAIVYPEIVLTPQGLTGNWSTILNAAERVRVRTKEKAVEQRRETNAWARNGCEVCQDDHMVIVGTDKNGNDIAVRCWGCSEGVMPSDWGRM
jgi:hypothetical protein